MALAALPVELIDAVLAPLAPTRPALAAAALTCSALHPSATRVLYRHLSLSNYARNLSLISLLASRPDLASLVHTFSVHLDDAEPPILQTYSHLQRALHLMTNLMSLALYVDASASWILSPPQGQNGQKSANTPNPGPSFYPRLEHLTCNFPLDPHLASFLGQVSSLISLTLSSAPFDADNESGPEHSSAPPTQSLLIPSSHLPLLEAYTGPAHLLPTLAFRPLKAVHLSSDLTLDLLPAAGAPSPDAAMPLFRGFSHRSTGLHTSQLQVLSAMTSAPPAQFLDAVAIAFPNLVCLRLMTTRALWDLPDLAFYSSIAETLSSLPHLVTFELAGIHWQSRPKPSSSAVKTEEKEWISPPVIPHTADPVPDEEEGDIEDRDYDFDGAFLDWSY